MPTTPKSAERSTRREPTDRKRDQKPAPGSPEIARVYAHPLRMRALRILNERVASPVEIARALDEPVNVVAYHVRILAEAGCVEQVSQRQRRGAVEHFYRATTVPMFTDEQWLELPVSLRRQLFGEAIRDIVGHVGSAAEHEGFDHPETHVSWTTMHLDDEGWDEVTALLAETLGKLPDVEARAAERLAASGADGEHRTEVVLLHFHRA